MKNMNKSSANGPAASLKRLNPGNQAGDKGYRPNWGTAVMLVAVASILLAGTWYLKEGESSFRVGSPAMKTYYAHSRMRIVDESATRALREQKMSDIGGVLVKDRKFPEEVRGKFAALEKRDYAAVLPDSLSRIMESLPEDAARRITGVASRIALSFQDSLSVGAELPADMLWRSLETSGLSIPEQNLAYQILDHVMERALVMDSEVTQEVRSLAASEVEPVERVLSVGDIIVREGEVISPEVALVLRAQGYPEAFFPWKTLAFIVTGVFFWVSWMGWFSRRREYHFDARESAFMITILIAGWVAMSLSSLLGGNGLGVIPLAGWAFLALPGSFAFQLVLWGGIIGSVITSGGSSAELMLSVFTSGLTASLAYLLLRKITDRLDLLRKMALLGVSLALGGFFIGWGLYLPSGGTALLSLSASALAWIVVTLAALPLWERLFDILTPVRLVDLTHPSHPLLKRLQLEAPGTYHHSLMVGTLAEAAAEKLRMDPLLVKAGAYFHDVGKLRRPQFFVENQQTGLNPHDELAPSLSALIIISHVRDGLEMGRQFGVPKKIRVFIGEHHGTTCLHYFFKKALGADPDLPMEQFCYPGGRPSSRESAVLMLADSVEAAVRAAAPAITDSRELEEMTKEVIDTKVAESQLSDVPLTFQDLTRIKAAFIETLKHMYHARKVTPLENAGDTPREPAVS